MAEFPHDAARPQPTPMPCAGDASSGVVLFGGSFDPPHLGHIGLARLARDRVASDARLVFVPAARSPHKDAGPIASPADRVAMLDLATADIERACVWTDEVDRAEEGPPHATPPPSYWVETLDRARRLLGEDPPIWFIMGADQVASFHRWREPERILALATPIVLLRGEASAPSSPDAGPINRAPWASWVVRAPLHPASSTAVRAALVRGEDSTARAMLDPRVWAYIRERGLYRA